MYSINTKSNSTEIQARKQQLEARIQRGLQTIFESKMGIAEAEAIRLEAEEMLARLKSRQEAEAYFASAKSRPESRV